jgi:hypothetical protein
MHRGGLLKENKDRSSGVLILKEHFVGELKHIGHPVNRIDSGCEVGKI